ncbi:hypothetical protein Hypma_000861 [Hypsizygus marmoreus]|uniref:Uncharacterized protein n=1 Tax=Hypsizygus marmoreus TaxID=39966 RepID=A0A369JGC3_HYPMA|nr:hypothetical protein Hypma_000861 [Hypsizygus marmoreus]
MVYQCRSAALLLLAFATFVFAEVQVYQPDKLYKRSTDFGLRAGKSEVPVLSYDKYDYAHFSFDGEIELEVEVKGKVPLSKISLVSSRFDRHNQLKLKKNTVVWRLKEEKYFILKVEGAKELVIAVDPIDTNAPDPFGPGIYNVASGKYRASRDGKQLSTPSFVAALADAADSKAASPTVYVPRGMYLVGNLVLPSKTSLYLAPGAVLRFTGRPEDYTEHWAKDGEGRSGTNWITTAENSTDIRIFGRGTIDGDAFAYKDANFAPSILVPTLTKNFIFDGPILRESGSTAVNVIRSSDVHIAHMKVFNRITDMTDNGSVDILESQNVTVRDSIGISEADSFTTKASKPPAPDRPTLPGSPQNGLDILFKDCLAWTVNYGFKVGQGAVTDQTNIKFLGSTVYDAAVAMGIHKKWGNGIVSNVTFENMIVKSTTYTTSHLSGMVGSWLALFIEDGKAGVGPINDVHIKNVLVMVGGGSEPLISGVAGANVTNVTFTNIWVPKDATTNPTPAASLEDLGLKNLRFTANITLHDGPSEEE